MNTARLKVHFAGPLVTYQDAGRFGHLRYGVPASGPMDRFGFTAAHAALAQDQTATAVEVSLGGLTLECTHGSVSLAIAGGNFRVTCAGRDSIGWGVHSLHSGDKLTIRAGDWGSWTYLAFAGHVVSPQWLGQSATHALSGFGGGALTTGDAVIIENPKVLEAREGEIPIPDIARPARDVSVVLGPQDHHFVPDAVKTFTSSSYTLTDAFDRMGARLSGPNLQIKDALSIPSEPIMRGSVQVSGDGVPTILLADHQTTGGYPKIATLISSETDRVAQNRSGSAIRFKVLQPQAAASESIGYQSVAAAYLETLAAPKASLQDRLMTLNLIDGVVAGTDD